jgi:hypothetical protein
VVPIVGQEPQIAGGSAAGAMHLEAATVSRGAVRSGPPLRVSASGPTGGSYLSEWTISTTAGWSTEASGTAERFVARATYVECHAGGDYADTHYARVRRKLPERDDVAISTPFTIQSTFELPSNFYDQQQGYLRIIATDNFLGSYRSSGTRVGTSTPDEWRLGFTVYGGDGLFRLVSDHENHGNIVLWTAPSRLATGVHTVSIRFAPSRETGGSWDLDIDNQLVGSGSNMQTVPTSVEGGDVVVTRLTGCIDGAAGQDEKSIQVNLFSLSITADA